MCNASRSRQSPSVMDASQASHENLMRFSALATALAERGEVDDCGDELLYCDPPPSSSSAA